LKEGKTVILIQLSGYERKLIHSFLSDSKGLNTSSIGEGMDRKLLIMPTSEFGTSGIDEALIINLDNLEN
jgi:R3H domain